MAVTPETWEKLERLISAATVRGRSLLLLGNEVGRRLADQASDLSGLVARLRRGPGGDEYANGFRDGLIQAIDAYMATAAAARDNERAIRIARDRGWLPILQAVKNRPLIQKEIAAQFFDDREDVASEELKRMRGESLLTVSLVEGQDRRKRPHRLTSLGAVAIQVLEKVERATGPAFEERRKAQQADLPAAASLYENVRLNADPNTVRI